MAEVRSVLRETQLDIEGGLVRARKVVKAASWSDFRACVEAAGSFAGEIGVTKAVAGHKEAAAGEIGVIKAVAGHKEAAAGEIGVTKAVAGHKEAAAGVTTEIGVSKADPPAMVTEASWIDYVILDEKEQPRLAPKEGRMTEPTGAMITKEKVSDTFMEILRDRRPFSKHPPLCDAHSKVLSKYNPKLLEEWLIDMARRNCCVDLHVSVLKQYEDQGFAEVGVDFTGGVKKVFVLP